MTRITFRKCKVCGDLHDIYNWPDNHVDWPIDNRSDLSAPMVVSSNLEKLGGLNGIQSQIDGKYYTCARRLRQEYQGHGVIEMGNDKAPPKKKKRVTRADVRPTVERAFSQAGLGSR